jgi:hypothetical protein
VAKLAGMDKMVAPAVERSIDGERGALLEWQVGARASDVKNRDERYDGNKQLAKAAVFDYVIGNEDRHAGNWIVGNDESVGGMKLTTLNLIDHSYSFPDLNHGEYHDYNEFLMDEAAERYGVTGMPTPRDVAKPYVDAKDKIVEKLNALGLPKGSAEGVARRIDKLSQMGDWSHMGDVAPELTSVKESPKQLDLPYTAEKPGAGIGITTVLGGLGVLPEPRKPNWLMGEVRENTQLREANAHLRGDK